MMLKIVRDVYLLITVFFHMKSVQTIDLAEIDITIEKALACHPHNPGLSVAVVKDGKVVFTKGYGVADKHTKTPVTNTTLFGLGSLTKAFTATQLVHQLDQHKHWSIYTHVADILGHGFQFSTDIRTHNANIRDILSHTLGFPPHNYVRFDQTMTRGELAKFWNVMPGATSIMSNSVDMSKWMLFLLNGGKNRNGHTVVSAKTLESTFQPRNAITLPTIGQYFTRPKVPVTTTVTSYGLGWKIGYYKDYRMIRHTGSIAGYSSLLTLIPDMNIGIFTTMTGPDHHYIYRTLLHNYLSDMALDESPWLNKSTVCSFPEPWFHIKQQARKTINKTFRIHRPEVNYVGHYTNPFYGSLEVKCNSTIQRLEMIYGVGRWILYPKNTADHFSGESIGVLKDLTDLWTITFETDPHHKNTIDGVEITSFESSDPPVFQKQTTNHQSVNIVG